MPGIIGGRTWVAVGLAVLAVGLGLAAGRVMADQRAAEERVRADNLRQAQQETRRAAQEIDRQLRGLETIAEELARDLERAPMGEAEIGERLAAAIARHPSIFAFGVAFAPYAFAPDRRLFAPYNVRRGGERRLIDIAAVYDYTEPAYEWYDLPMRQGRMWIEPYFAEAADTLVANHSVPFRHPDPAQQGQGFAGVVVINFSLDDVRELVLGLNLGPAGYGFVLSRRAAYLSFPLAELVAARKTVFEVARENGDVTLGRLADSVAAGRAGIFDHVNYSTGQASWIAVEPIAATGWAMGGTFIKAELPVPAQESRRRAILAVSLGLGAVLLGALAAAVWRGRPAGWWMVSLASAAAVVGASVAVVRLAQVHVDPAAGAGLQLTDRASLSKSVERLAAATLPKRRGALIPVPTGLLVETIRFDSISEVSATGIVWQKLPAMLAAASTARLLLPDASVLRLQELWRRPAADHELRAWRFETSLRQRLSAAQYPFDRAEIALRLRPPAADGLVLVPDLAGYTVLTPSSRPALSPTLALPGWTVERSLFGFVQPSLLTTFGLAERAVPVPDLVLSVHVRRNWLDPAVSGLIPIGAILAIVFTMLVMNTASKEKGDAFGQKPIQFVLLSSSLLFIAILGQIALRGKVAAEGIVYLEYGYLVIYGLILLAIANALLLARRRGGVLVNYDDNLIPRLAYWPLVALSMYGLTVARFY